jgi:hypothetical protein
MAEPLQPLFLIHYTQPITAEKYEAFLEAYIKSKEDTNPFTYCPDAIRNHAIYDNPFNTKFRLDMQKSPIDGYCMSTKCMKKKKHSALLYRHVKYHCLECLSQTIYDIKTKTSFISMQVNFINPNFAPLTQDKMHINIRININEKGVFINDVLVEHKWEQIEPQPDQSVYRLNVFTDYNFIMDGEHRSLFGVFIGRLQGKFACKSLFMGKLCPEAEKSGGFRNEVCPPGTCGWIEIEKKNNRGVIQIGDYCPRCNLVEKPYLKEKVEISVIEKPFLKEKVEITAIEKPNFELDNLREAYDQLEKINQKLSQKCQKLNWELKKLEAENRALLKTNIELINRENKNLLCENLSLKLENK